MFTYRTPRLELAFRQIKRIKSVQTLVVLKLPMFVDSNKMIADREFLSETEVKMVDGFQDERREKELGCKLL